MSDAKKSKVVSYKITGGPGNNTNYKDTLPERSSTKLGRYSRPFNPASAPSLSGEHGKLIHEDGKIFYEDINNMNGSDIIDAAGNKRHIQHQKVELKKGDRISLPATQNPKDNFVINILGFGDDDKTTPPAQKTQIHQTPIANSVPPTRTMPIETAIYTEGNDFEGGHKFERYQNILIGTKMIYSEKTPEGILMACSGVISCRGSSNFNTFLYGVIPKQKITEQDIIDYFTSLEKKADSLGVSFKGDLVSEVFETSGKKIEQNPKNIEKNIYFVGKDTNLPALIASELNKGHKSVGINRSKREIRDVPVDEIFQYGEPLEKREPIKPFVSEPPKKSLMDIFRKYIH